MPAQQGTESAVASRTSEPSAPEANLATIDGAARRMSLEDKKPSAALCAAAAAAAAAAMGAGGGASSGDEDMSPSGMRPERRSSIDAAVSALQPPARVMAGAGSTVAAPSSGFNLVWQRRQDGRGWSMGGTSQGADGGGGDDDAPRGTATSTTATAPATATTSTTAAAATTATMAASLSTGRGAPSAAAAAAADAADAAAAAAAAAAAPAKVASGQERHAAYVAEQHQRQLSPRRRVGFGSASARLLPPSAAPRRAPSPSRPLSPRLLRPTASSARACEVAKDLRASAMASAVDAPAGASIGFTSSAARFSSSSGCHFSGPDAAAAGPGSGARPVGPGARAKPLPLNALSAVAAAHALSSGLTPAELYMKLAQQPSAAAVEETLALLQRDAAASGGASVGRAGMRSLDGRARGAPPTVSEASCTIQTYGRGLVSRRLRQRLRAARALQAIVRGFVARRRHVRARREAQARDARYERLERLASPRAPLPPAAASAQRGKWAERDAIRKLPVARLRGAPPSPNGRPAHQRLHEHASERDERRKAVLAEQSEREERARQPSSTGRVHNVPSRVDSHWVDPRSTRPPSPRNRSARSEEGEPMRSPTNSPTRRGW